MPVLVSLPRRVEHGIAHLARLARILGVDEDAGGARSDPARLSSCRGSRRRRARAFVPIWMDPLMTLNADTFGSDVLARVGIDERVRRSPAPVSARRGSRQGARRRTPAGRDVRYPRVTLDEVAARGAELVILPDEPHAFSAEDEARVPRGAAEARVVRVSGKDLFWYGAWTIDALAAAIAQLTN